MLFKTFSILALSVSAAYGSVMRTRCGAPEPEEGIKAAAKSQLAKFLKDQAAGIVFKRNNIVVDTYVHVLRSGTAVSQGNVPDSQIYAQIQVLNDDFATTGVSFELKGITRTTNSNYFNDNNELAMKQALRQGDYSTLNIYLQNLSGGTLGYCYFPKANPSTTDRTRDGCAVRFDTLPGGTASPFNLGRTGTHEVGHWFGLFHTFQGGCASSAAGGDGIADTPAERSPAYGCPVGRDSCTGSAFAGVDPIHNFMDYTDDSCMDHFTTAQAARIQSFWNTYRG